MRCPYRTSPHLAGCPAKRVTASCRKQPGERVMTHEVVCVDLRRVTNGEAPHDGSGTRIAMDLTDNDASSAVLSVTGIGKTYAEPVLADVSLTLRAGEALALTGENGAGKSTLSKIVGGLVVPTTGTMTLGGVPYAPASRTEAEALGVRMVMQELNLLPTLSVAENLLGQGAIP